MKEGINQNKDTKEREQQLEPQLVAITTTTKRTPSCHLNALLTEHNGLVTQLSIELIRSYNNESTENLKSLRALEALLDGTIRTAAHGPEMLLPAIGAFHKVAEKNKKFLGVDLPKLKELLSPEIARAQDALLDAQHIFTKPFRTLISGQSYNAFAKKNTAHYSISIIEVSQSIYRLPRHDIPIENALLCDALFVLAEEVIHVMQALQEEADLAYLKNDFPFTSTLAKEFMDIKYRDSKSDRDPFSDESAKGDRNAIYEIDALGKLIEYSKMHNFPTECLARAISHNHMETRSEFTSWLIKKGHIKESEYTAHCYLVSKGQYNEIPNPLTGESKLNDFLVGYVDLISRASNPSFMTYNFMKIIRHIATTDIGSTQENIPPIEQLPKLLSAAVKKGVLIETQLSLANLGLEKSDPTIAIILTEYLRRIGYLVSK